jgi:microcystin-dependent protein
VNSGGTIYSTIVSSVFGALTTVTVINDSGVLDSGLSAVAYGLLNAANPSSPYLMQYPSIVAVSSDIGISGTAMRNLHVVQSTATLTITSSVFVAVGDFLRVKSVTVGDVRIKTSGSDTIDGLSASTAALAYRLPSYTTCELSKISASTFVLSIRPDVEIGRILEYATTTAPLGTVLCDGSSYAQTSLPALFAAIGSSFGGVNATSFSVPDTRGRVSIGVDPTLLRITVASSSGANASTVGGIGGSQTHVLITAEIPSHQHTISTFAGFSAGSGIDGGGDGVQVGDKNTGLSGGGGAHSNTQPWIAMFYCIKT